VSQTRTLYAVFGLCWPRHRDFVMSDRPIEMNFYGWVGDVSIRLPYIYPNRTLCFTKTLTGTLSATSSSKSSLGQNLIGRFLWSAMLEELQRNYSYVALVWYGLVERAKANKISEAKAKQRQSSASLGLETHGLTRTITSMTAE
jgi:hypothetical protein